MKEKERAHRCALLSDCKALVRIYLSDSAHMLREVHCAYTRT
jgi:hypothetical protein